MARHVMQKSYYASFLQLIGGILHIWRVSCGGKKKGCARKITDYYFWNRKMQNEEEKKTHIIRFGV